MKKKIGAVVALKSGKYTVKKFSKSDDGHFENMDFSTVDISTVDFSTVNENFNKINKYTPLEFVSSWKRI